MALAPAPIATPRLLLVPVSPELAVSVVDGDVSTIVAGDGWPHADTADGMRIALARGHAPGWLVTLDGVVIGECGMHGEPDSSGELELGYGLARPYRGRGYGTEVVAGLSRWLLDQDGVLRVLGRVDVDNTPSRRALAHAGFVLEWTGRRYASYALTG
jgi:RimJ/RimL family protein N-acetyltransferase